MKNLVKVKLTLSTNQRNPYFSLYGLISNSEADCFYNTIYLEKGRACNASEHNAFRRDSSNITPCLVIKVVLITHQCFSYFWTVVTLCEDIRPTASKLGVGKKLRGDMVGTAAPKGLKGYQTLYDLVLSSKTWGKGGGRMHVHGYSVCLLKVPVHVLRPCFPGRGWTLLDNAVILLLQCGKKQERIFIADENCPYFLGLWWFYLDFQVGNLLCWCMWSCEELTNVEFNDNSVAHRQEVENVWCICPGFGSRGSAGVTSVRRGQGLPCAGQR